MIIYKNIAAWKMLGLLLFVLLTSEISFQSSHIQTQKKFSKSNPIREVTAGKINLAMSALSNLENSLDQIEGVSQKTSVTRALNIIEQQFIDKNRIKYDVFLKAVLKDLEAKYQFSFQQKEILFLARGVSSRVKTNRWTNSGISLAAKSSERLLEGIKKSPRNNINQEDFEIVYAAIELILKKEYKISGKDVLYEALNSILRTLDPHCSFLSEAEYQELRSGTHGNFGGVGVVLDETLQIPFVREVIFNSPAHIGGVRPGDLILRIGDANTAFIPFENVIERIRAIKTNEPTEVFVQRVKTQKIERIFLTREEIPTHSVETLIVENHPEILHIKVLSFSSRVSEEVLQAYQFASSKRELKSIILDLRGNPGGLLDQAVALADLFLKEGNIVETRSRYDRQLETASKGVKISLPLTVLTNASSASASEIVAGALQDNNRAFIIGEKTYGKGSVQSIFELSNGSALKLTIAHYFTPNGKSIQGVGIQPNIEVRMYRKTGESIWVAGNSESEREQNLAAHLDNPNTLTFGAINPEKITIWAEIPSQNLTDSLLESYSFHYPHFENYNNNVNLKEDVFARVALQKEEFVKFASQNPAQKVLMSPLSGDVKELTSRSFLSATAWTGFRVSQIPDAPEFWKQLKCNMSERQKNKERSCLNSLPSELVAFLKSKQSSSKTQIEVLQKESLTDLEKAIGQIDISTLPSFKKEKDLENDTELNLDFQIEYSELKNTSWKDSQKENGWNEFTLRLPKESSVASLVLIPLVQKNWAFESLKIPILEDFFGGKYAKIRYRKTQDKIQHSNFQGVLGAAFFDRKSNYMRSMEIFDFTEKQNF